MAKVLGSDLGLGLHWLVFLGGGRKTGWRKFLPPGNEPETSLCRNNWILSPLDEQGQSEGNSVVTLWRQKINRACGYRVGTDLEDWVMVFQPQLIYSYLESPLIMNLVSRLTDRFHLPILPHFMDEWQNTLNGRRPSDLWWFIRQKLELHRILEYAPLGIAISDKMASEYQKRYRIPFHTFMNSANPCLFLSKQNTDVLKELHLVYAGSGLGLGREPIILYLARLVQELNRAGYPITLTIIARIDQVDNLPQGDGVVVLDFMQEEKLATLLSHNDIAVLAEGFDRGSMRYSRISFSSKIPVYLMSGCYILAIGPKSASLNRIY